MEFPTVKNVSTEKYDLIKSLLAKDFSLTSGIIVLPENFETAVNEEDYRFSSSTETFVKLAKLNKLPIYVIETQQEIHLIENHSFEWVFPTLFISSLYLTQNPLAISIAINMISTYLLKLFHQDKTRKVKLNIFYEDNGAKITKKIEYEGSIDGLGKVTELCNNLSL